MKKKAKIRKRPQNARDPLQAALALTMAWLLFQGLVYLFAFDSLARLLRLRWDANTIPLLRSQGLSMLVLVFYLVHALDRPRKQTLAVDTLLIMLLGSSVITMSAVLRGIYSPSDWFILAANIGLAASLMKHRARARDRRPAENVISEAAPAPQVAVSGGQAGRAASSRILDSLAWLQAQSGTRPAWQPNPIQPMETHRPARQEKDPLDGLDLKKIPAAIGLSPELLERLRNRPKSGWSPEKLLAPPAASPGPKAQAATPAPFPPTRARQMRPPPIPLPPPGKPLIARRRRRGLSEAVPSLH